MKALDEDKEAKKDSEFMNEQKKISPICLTGFILSLLSPVVTFGGLFLYFLHGSVRFFGGSHNKIIFLNRVIILGIVFMIAGLILSVLGNRSLDKKGYRGKRLAVTGIVISILMIIVYLIGASFVWYEDTHRESPPTYQNEYN